MQSPRLTPLVFCWLALALACAAPEEGREAVPKRPPATPAQSELERGDEPLVVFLGDSLTAGLGLEEAQAFPGQLRRLLAEQGTVIGIVNAGISGDTTAGGLRRVGWVLRQRPDVVVVELGANDGLRGLPPEVTEQNLRKIIRSCREAGAEVLLLGMKVPPNYGGEYAGRFEAVFARLAAELQVPLVPFFLEGVAGDPRMNLADGIHPNARGHRRAAENLLAPLSELLGKLGDGSREISASPSP